MGHYGITKYDVIKNFQWPGERYYTILLTEDHKEIHAITSLKKKHKYIFKNLNGWAANFTVLSSGWLDYGNFHFCFSVLSKPIRILCFCLQKNGYLVSQSNRNESKNKQIEPNQIYSFCTAKGNHKQNKRQPTD